MKGKQVYDLTVRGENVHIEFKKINDSRRLNRSGSKDPNLFMIQGVLECMATLPASFGGEWWKQHYPNTGYPGRGLAFCTRRDHWSALKGRHIALAEALTYPGHDDILNAEIVSAFTEEEQRRAAKPKGPARQPKTAKPKPRKRKQQELVQVLADLRDVLQKLAYPIYSIQPAGYSLQDMEHIQVREESIAKFCGAVGPACESDSVYEPEKKENA